MSMELTIYSRRLSKTYRIYRFTEYSVDMDLQTDADQFQIKFSNGTPSIALSGIFNKFDPIDLKINGQGVLRGYLDSVRYIDNYCIIVGRDLMGIYIDNDTQPQTLKNVKPKDYITKRVHEFNPEVNVEFLSTISAMKELKINVGQTELATMQSTLVQDDLSMWIIYDTIYVGKYNYGAKPTHYFSRGLPMDISGIPFDNLSIEDDGTSLAGEFRIYGTQGSGKDKISGIAKNSWMTTNKIRRVKMLQQDETTYASKYNSHALFAIREQFRNSIMVTFDLKTTDHLILPNTTIVLTDWRHKLDGVFFVRGVNYSKTISNGARTHVTVVPADHTFDMIWILDPASGSNVTSGVANTPYILGLPDMTMEQFLAKRVKK